MVILSWNVLLVKALYVNMVQCTLIALIIDDSEPAVQLLWHACTSSRVLSQISVKWHPSTPFVRDAQLALLAPLIPLLEAI